MSGHLLNGQTHTFKQTSCAVRGSPAGFPEAKSVLLKHRLISTKATEPTSADMRTSQHKAINIQKASISTATLRCKQSGVSSLPPWGVTWSSHLLSCCTVLALREKKGHVFQLPKGPKHLSQIFRSDFDAQEPSTNGPPGLVHTAQL